MKVVVFAHTPPPFHGQSYMVKLMLDGLRARGQEHGLELIHINAKLSSNLESIGKIEWLKLFLVLKYCAQAYFYRFVRRADVFYYVPAPGARAPLYRDWIVMFLCRPLFKKIVLHWHAIGLGKWLNESAKLWEKKITGRLLGDVDLSIVLSEFGRTNAMQFSPRKIEVVPNGIPDPCPEFEQSILPERERRFRERREGTTFTVLFLGACSAAKGLFAALDAIALLNERVKNGKSQIGVRLMVAGDFVSQAERARFDARLVQPDLEGAAEPLVVYKGFAQGDAKKILFRRADCLCFPTCYAAEGQPVTLIEALAFGLPVVATRWRGIPELLAGTESRTVEDQNPVMIAAALQELVDIGDWAKNRRLFLERYCLDKYLEGLKKAFATIG